MLMSPTEYVYTIRDQKRIKNVGEIFGSHDGEFEDERLLGCRILQSDRN